MRPILSFIAFSLSERQKAEGGGGGGVFRLRSCLSAPPPKPRLVTSAIVLERKARSNKFPHHWGHKSRSFNHQVSVISFVS